MTDRNELLDAKLRGLHRDRDVAAVWHAPYGALVALRHTGRLDKPWQLERLDINGTQYRMARFWTEDAASEHMDRDQMCHQVDFAKLA